ncbi:lasso peptide biosynthesis B2 protein [Thermoactinospora rubra]|uniref:lasso peptide biosynthesis B2 protein n=1 Tax=Thermoactinospora rubra TaxID=1088767 RepID=UPI000A0FBA6F|nr:lasso peptide biosynthesis B2 protein [Thermoactinospora rubra]
MTFVAAYDRPGVPWRSRPAAWLAIGAARIIASRSPRQIRRILEVVRRGARPARYAHAARARKAVTGLSARCAGEGCLQRAIAVALLCRLRGMWPTWHVGVRIEPFGAHAWVEADGVPVDEQQPAGYYMPLITVAARP